MISEGVSKISLSLIWEKRRETILSPPLPSQAAPLCWHGVSVFTVMLLLFSTASCLAGRLTRRLQLGLFAHLHTHTGLSPSADSRMQHKLPVLTFKALRGLACPSPTMSLPGTFGPPPAASRFRAPSRDYALPPWLSPISSASRGTCSERPLESEPALITDLTYLFSPFTLASTTLPSPCGFPL